MIQVLECNSEAVELSSRASSMREAEWRRVIGERFGVDLHSCSDDLHGSLVSTWEIGAVTAISVGLGACEMSVSSNKKAVRGGHLLLKFVREGTLNVEQAGQSRSVAAGSMIVVDPNVPFFESCTHRLLMTVLWIPRLSLRDRGISATLSTLYVPELEDPDVLAVRDLIFSTLQNSTHVTTSFSARMGEHLLDVMDVLLDASQSTGRDARREMSLQLVKRYVQGHYDDPTLSAESVAEEIGYSPNYINRLLRAEGTSLMRYVWEMRLQKAAALLVSAPRLNVSEVAYRCGFADPAHFSRAFRTRFGKKPSETFGRNEGHARVSQH